MQKSSNGQMSVGKLLAIIMAVVFIVIIIVGSSQGWFSPITEKITSEANKILIMFAKQKDSELISSEDFCYYELIHSENGNDFNKSFCGDYCILNSTEGLSGINIGDDKIYKINITKKSIDSYVLFNSNIPKHTFTREYLGTIFDKRTDKQNLLDIIKLKDELESNKNWLDKSDFLYSGVDYSFLDDYRLFSNKSFPMYVSLKYSLNNDIFTIGYNQKIYNYLIEYYYNKLFSLEENVELERELEDKIDALTEIIITDYGIDSEFANLELSDEKIEKIKNNCSSIWILDIGKDCAGIIRYKNEYPEDFNEKCSSVLSTSSLNNYILYKCYILNDGTPSEIQNYAEILATELKDKSQSKNLMLGIYNNEYINDILLSSDITKQKKEVLDVLNEFKNNNTKAQQFLYSKIESLLNNIFNLEPTSNIEQKELIVDEFFKSQDSEVYFKINQTINISDYYSNCGEWHVENQINIITYGNNYGIIYNSLDKFEKKQHYVNAKTKDCDSEDIPNNKFFIVEYNLKTRQWDLILKNTYNIKTLEKEINELQELYDLYLFSKESCF